MRYLFAIAFVATLAAFVQESHAQRPLRDLFEEFDRHRPRGRMLKQMFNGNENTADEQNSGNPQRTNPNAQQQPTPAQAQQQFRNGNPNARYNGQQPTPAPRQPNFGANDPRQNIRAGNQSSAANQTLNNNAGQQTSAWPQPRSATPQSTQSTAANGKPAGNQVELGAKLTTARNGEGLVVGQVTRGSAADEAGLKNGDIITNFGGLEITKEDQLNDVLSVLNQGDQIEVEYTRRGKSDKIFVQFGEPEVDQLSAPAEQAANSRNAASGVTEPRFENASSSRNLRAQNGAGDYDPIQPPGSNSAGTNPYLDSPVSVLSDLKTNPARASQPQARHTNEQDLTRQIGELRNVIKQQEQIIQNMQNQLSRMQQPTNNYRRGSQPTLAPRGR